MKKLSALLLILALVLGMAACSSGSKDQEAFDAANALLEAGDYEGAREAFENIETYKMFMRISDKINEIDEHLRKEKLGFLEGVWMDLSGEIVVTCDGEGNYSYNYVLDGSGRTYEETAWLNEDGTILMIGQLTPTEIDGVTHLIGENIHLVPESAYAALGAQIVELSADNWETYFELREVIGVQENNFGEVTELKPGYGVFLKPEYAEKLVNPHTAIDVTFKYTSNIAHHYCEIDKENLSVTIGAPIPYWQTEMSKEGTANVYYADPDFTPQRSPFSGCFAAEIVGYIYENDGKYEGSFHEDLVITDAIGTMKLYP